MTKLEPGTYRLRIDVENPKPDRRQRHDWRALVKWEKGMVFRVRFDPYLKSPDANDVDALELWHGRYPHMSFSSWREGFWELLAPYLDRIDETPSQWMRREHGHDAGAPWGILDMLVAEGRLTLDDVKELTERYYASLG